MTPDHCPGYRESNRSLLGICCCCLRHDDNGSMSPPAWLDEQNRIWRCGERVVLVISPTWRAGGQTST